MCVHVGCESWTEKCPDARHRRIGTFWGSSSPVSVYAPYESQLSVKAQIVSRWPDAKYVHCHTVQFISRLSAQRRPELR